jgi:hypothetical protein
MVGFKNRISTFASDDYGDDYQRVNYLILNPLLRVFLSSRDIMKLRFKDPVVACSWQLVVFEPVISNPWNIYG